MTKLAFLDTETTGLYPERGHEMWELAIIVRDGEDWMNGEWQWLLGVDLAAADPNGLRIGHFYERTRRTPLGRPRWNSPGRNDWQLTSETEAAKSVANLLDGAHIVGAVPSFDAAFLAPWLRRHGQAPTWHYHLVTVEALAAGFLAGHEACRRRQDFPAFEHHAAPPWDSETLSQALSVDPKRFERHTALGDARWAMALYDAVMG